MSNNNIRIGCFEIQPTFHVAFDHEERVVASLSQPQQQSEYRRVLIPRQPLPHKAVELGFGPLHDIVCTQLQVVVSYKNDRTNSVDIVN